MHAGSKTTMAVREKDSFQKLAELAKAKVN